HGGAGDAPGGVPFLGGADEELVAGLDDDRVAAGVDGRFVDAAREVHHDRAVPIEVRVEGQVDLDGRRVLLGEIERVERVPADEVGGRSVRADAEVADAVREGGVVGGVEVRELIPGAPATVGLVRIESVD